MKDHEINYLNEAADLILKGSGLWAVAALVLKTALSQSHWVFWLVLPVTTVLLATLACFLFIAAVVRVEKAFSGDRLLPRWAETVVGVVGGVIIAITIYSLLSSVLPSH